VRSLKGYLVVGSAEEKGNRLDGPVVVPFSFQVSLLESLGATSISVLHPSTSLFHI